MGSARRTAAFAFADLFAGIGGFHAALAALGGTAAYAVEIDPPAAEVYRRNWGLDPLGDLVTATDGRMEVPDHDVLVAGFPCQPFSKSGYQRGMDEARGTLFWNICRVLEERRPAVVLLENVRNLAGPRHAHEWHVIIRSLRELGYRVSSTPAVFSPHLLPPELGGRPQIRERVFIAATYVGGLQDLDVEPVVLNRPVEGWDPSSWDVQRDLLDPEVDAAEAASLRLTVAETRWVDAWDDFVQHLRVRMIKLPGFPIWADEFTHIDNLRIDPSTPAWKADFLRKNARLYTDHRDLIEPWLQRWDHLDGFPPSRRKLEWQAQDEKRLWDTVMHFRPSGIRAKRATYLPALVAITQTSIIGPLGRRISIREAAGLQGLPRGFDFGSQRAALTYKQLGNGVNVGVAHYVLRQQVLRDQKLIARRAPGLVKAVLAAPANPDASLASHVPTAARAS
jgi:DNA (cytosine-5)-methyltransferase 1